MAPNGEPTDPNRPAAETDSELELDTARDEPDRRTALMAVAAVLAVVVVILLVVLLTRDDDGDDDQPAVDTTTTTLEETTTTEATTSTTEETTTSTTEPGGTEVTDEEAATIAWPAPGGSRSFATPDDLVRAFATDLVGFTAPVVGEFMGGDSRSGELEVRATDTGPATTVLVRQMSDDNWYVLGASTPEIEVDDPIAGTAIDAPLIVAGRAAAFEGTVQVAVYVWGEDEPLGTGFVTGSGGGEMGPFSGEIDWDNPGGGRGLVVFSSEGGEDGGTWQATVVPVGFIGGD